MNTPQTFPHSVAVAASGCSGKHLQQWRQRELIDDIGTINVTGRAEYTRSDLIVLRTMGEMVRFGIAPQMAAIAAKKMRHDLADKYFLPEGPRILAVVWNNVNDYGGAKYEQFGFAAYEQTDFGKFLSGDAKSPEGHASILIPLTDLIKKVDEVIGREAR